jgi:hypothetical protein
MAAVICAHRTRGGGPWHSTSARDHRVFSGALDRGRLGLVERLAARAVKAPDGDSRPWGEIDAWTETIASEVGALVPT